MSAYVTGGWACHSICTVVGLSVGASHHPLKPPATCCGGGSCVSSMLADQPVLKPSPMINQQPVGHAATVAVRVVRVRSTVTCGAGVRAAADTPSSSTS